jgi:hypothetical protein
MNNLITLGGNHDRPETRSYKNMSSMLNCEFNLPKKDWFFNMYLNLAFIDTFLYLFQALYQLIYIHLSLNMSRSQTKSTQILSGVRAKESTSLQTTQSYIEAHRYITPRSTRAFTEPSHNIDSNLMGIINDKAPNRMEKLLRKKGIPSPSQRQRKSAKCH